MLSCALDHLETTIGNAHWIPSIPGRRLPSFNCNPLPVLIPGCPCWQPGCENLYRYVLNC